jgi:nucleotide-binding universal stress UspA family protein
MAKKANRPRIVVGVDGSDSSMAALQWAVEEARRWGASIDAVTAWEYPTATGAPVPLPPDYMPGAIAAVVTEACVNKVADGLDIPIHVTVLEGPARTVLPDSAQEAAMLVVGRRGRSVVPGLTLGSVSDACVRHASCPVVVVHESGAP